MNTIEGFEVLEIFKRDENIPNTMCSIATWVFISLRQVDNWKKKIVYRV